MANRQLWSKDEEEKLIECYKNKQDPRTIFTYRPEGSIFHKASRLGLKWYDFQLNCKKCGVLLTEDNWYPTSRTKRDYICKVCVRRKSEKVRKDNPNRTRRWYQENYLTIKTGRILCRKRQKPEKCEVCNINNATAYHHWGKVERGESISGIWVCNRCHFLAEAVDKGFIEKYIKAKGRILNNESTSN